MSAVDADWSDKMPATYVDEFGIEQATWDGWEASNAGS
jgi:hypothetical protein